MKIPGPIPVILEALRNSRDNLNIVQVGSHAGRTVNDPLFPFISRYFSKRRTAPGRALLIEPVPYLFESLQRNYKDCIHVIFRNVAVTETEGEYDLFFLREPNDLEARDLPFWITQLGTLLPERAQALLQSPNEQVRQYARGALTQKKIQGSTINNLCDSEGIESIDFLQIDSEGYDYRILRSLNFEKFRPSFIHFEKEGLTHNEKLLAEELLDRKGYRWQNQNGDTLCWLPAEVL